MKESTKLKLKEDYESNGFSIRDYEKVGKYNTYLIVTVIVLMLVSFALGAFGQYVDHAQAWQKITYNCLETFRDIPSYKAQEFCKNILGVAP